MSIPLTHGGISGVSEIDGYSKLLAPNEAPRPDKSTSGEKPAENIIHIIRSLYDSAKRARKSREAKWSEYQNFYLGKQWNPPRTAPRSSPVLNIIRPVVQTVVPIMTDTSPSFGLLAKDPNDFKVVELFTEVTKRWWDTRSMNHVLVEALMDAAVLDVGILKVVWNDDLDDGKGDVEVVVCDPRNIYVPRNAMDFNRNCPWIIHEFFKSRGNLALKFSKFADQIKHASAYKKPFEAEDSDMRVHVVSPIDQDRSAPDNKGSAGDNIAANEDLRVWEAWMEDDTVIEEQQINEGESGVEIETVLKKKYPHGRLVTMLPDDKLVLQDVPNPNRDGDNPFIRIVNTLLPRSFYGQGEVESLIEPQMMINKIFSVIIDWANTMVNCNWIVDEDSGVDPDMITNAMGQVIVKKAGSVVQRDTPPSLPPQIFELYHNLLDYVDQASGVHDVTQGRKPIGITAAEAIESLQEAAQTRIRLKERNLLVSLQRLGRLVLSRMLQYYTEPRVMRLTGRDDLQGAWPRYVRFFVEMTENEMYRLVQEPVEYNEQAGGYVKGDTQVSEPTMGDFDIDVTSGTSLPFIKAQRAEQAMRMWENKSIDRKALLETLDFPEKEAIIARMEEAEKAQAQEAPMAAPA